MRTADPTNAKEVVEWLRRRGSRRNRDGMARYGIVADDVAGVSVGDLRTIAKKLGRNDRLASDLWKTGVYEARMLVAFVGDPDALTPAQMDRWTKDFDNWAICDALCFHLYDKSPLAWSKVRKWSSAKAEFEKRAAFALLAGLALHDRSTPDSRFVASLPLIRRAAGDDRNFVKKAVSWALRSIGGRSESLNDAAIELASELAESTDRTERWIGKDTLRDVTRPMVRARARKRGGQRGAVTSS